MSAADAGWPVLVVAAVVGYLLGSLSPATVIARRAGADLRQGGSGNPGATNVGRLLGRRVGLLVALLDVAKGFVPAVAFGAVAAPAGMLAGFAAVVGHVTSPFLRGRGGRGVATAAGAILGSQPLWAPVVLLVWIVVLALSRWVALASVSAAVAVVVVAVAVRASGASLLWAVGMAAIVVVRHRSNLLRWWSARR